VKYTNQIYELLESVEGKGHPDYPLFRSEYSPASRMPCKGMEEWIAGRLLASDLDSIKQYAELTVGPELPLGPPLEELIRRTIQKAERIFNIYVNRQMPELSDELAALLFSTIYLYGVVDELIQAATEEIVWEKYRQENPELYEYQAIRDAHLSSQEFARRTKWNYLSGNHLSVAKTIIPFEYDFGVQPLLSDLWEFAKDYREKEGSLPDEDESELQPLDEERIEELSVLDIIARLPNGIAISKPLLAHDDAQGLRDRLSRVSASARRHFFDAIEYTSTVYHSEKIDLGEGHYLKLSIGEQGNPRPRSIYDMTYYGTRSMGIDEKATAVELERAGLIEYTVSAEQVIRSLLKAELQALLSSKGIYCAKSWNKSRMAELVLSHASAEAEEIGRQRRFCIVSEKWKKAAEELRPLLAYYDLAFGIWQVFRFRFKSA
jgi:hypothetical protein